MRKIPGQFSKTIIQSSTFSKSVLSRKFPQDTQNAMLTSKLDDFYQDSQIISVKGREHSSEHFPKKHQKFFCSRWSNFDKPEGQFQPKNKEFFNQISKFSNLSIFFGEKLIFSQKKSYIYVEWNFGKSDEKFMPETQQNSSSFFEFKHTNNFSSPKKVYFSEEIVWMRGMKNLKAGWKTFFEKSPKIHSSKIGQLLFEKSLCRKNQFP